MYRVSQLIASANINFSLKNDSRTIVIDFADNYDIDSLLEQLQPAGHHSGKSLSLHFDDLKGNDLLPVIDVYLNLAHNSTPKNKNYVGAMTLYGLGESSEESAEHDGSGQHRVFDAGEVFSRVRSQPNWSAKQFKLTLIPSRSLPADAILTIGTIALYVNEN